MIFLNRYWDTIRKYVPFWGLYIRISCDLIFIPDPTIVTAMKVCQYFCPFLVNFSLSCKSLDFPFVKKKNAVFFGKCVVRLVMCSMLSSLHNFLITCFLLTYNEVQNQKPYEYLKFHSILGFFFSQNHLTSLLSHYELESAIFLLFHFLECCRRYFILFFDHFVAALDFINKMKFWSWYSPQNFFLIFLNILYKTTNISPF